MASPPAQVNPAGLAMHEGQAIFNAAEAMLKGMLEADREVALITGPDRSFAELFETAQDESVADLLRRHGTTVLPTPSARRSLMIALRRARTGDCVFTLVPNSQLHTVLGELSQAGSLALASPGGDGASESGGALCVVLEDNPRGNAPVCPRQTARSMGLACIEPATVNQLRDAMDQVIRLSRAGGCAIGVIVHHLILRSVATLEARPNRVASALDVTLLKRKRRQRITESGGLLRMARRMELNRVRALPSPGERVAVGFITVGPADAALAHLTQTLRLRGRVPVLQLGLLNPLDEVLIERFLTRCERVVVLEPRPGSVQGELLATAELIRQRGSVPAAVWGRLVPPGGDDAAREMHADEAVHISTLARRIIHLLHPLRPGLQVGSRLTASPPELQQRPARRGEGIGPAAAYAALRRILADADQRLRAQAADQEQAATTALAINGANPPGSADRVVRVEVWHAREFREVGAAVPSHVAASGEPYITAVIDLDSEPGELERLIRAHVPAELAERVKVITADLTEHAKLRDRIADAAVLDQVTFFALRDGDPPRFSLNRVEQALADTDRLGFEPRQWLIRPADEVCAIRDHMEGDIDVARDAEGAVSDVRRLLGVPATSGGDDDPGEAALPEAAQELDSIMRTRYVVEKLSRRQSSRMRVKVRPLLEQIEVIRTRPPAWAWRSGRRERLELPAPIHARQPVWRIHLAGWRGDAPGVAARALCEAGRNMGYEVSAVHEPAFVGAGCRAWAQVLFMRGSSDPDATQPPLVPYGEADVLLGMDWQETLRSIDPRDTLQVADRDHTCSLVNSGTFQADFRAAPTAAERGALAQSLRAVSRDDCCTVHDYAAACRTWFYTDRVTDLAMLGSAFQLGLLPVRLDAIEAALKRLETSGYGRSLEAFDFGRSLAVDDRLLPAGRKHRDEVVEDLNRITRRMVLSVRRSRWGGRAIARNFQRLLEQCLVSTPGLAETAAGRQAQRDMVAALYRCLEWGGMDYANKYGQLLMALYRADRGEKGRAITRDAVLPLAEAMLVRDQVYIACLAASPELRRRLQATGSHGGGLNVKRARGDCMERRYLTRMELIAFNRRYRLDLRTSDWLARVAKASRLVLPHAWRGSRRDRELRQYMIDFIQRATHECGRNYDAWAEAMHRLHHHAVEQRLRSMAVSEVRMLADGAELNARS
jgi:Pyruvate/2-oxoacid:ferredoxin oxidoreductase gamma subunit